MERLVLIAPNWLGDAVMALPAIADVLAARRHSRLAIAARASIAPLFSLVNGIDEVIALPSRGAWPLDGFDVAILLPNSFHAAMRVARAGIPERWAYRTDCRGMLLTRAIERTSKGVHQIDSYRRLVSALGFPNGGDAPRLAISDVVRDNGRAILQRAGWGGRAPLLAIAPGAAFGSAKRWPARSFADLATGVAEDGVVTVMLGAQADRPIADEVMRHAAGRSTILDAVGQTDVTALAGVLAHCRALAANDSGALHLGAALGIRVVAVFGPTDERVTAPRSASGAGVQVLTSPTWCRPCGLRECPLDHACMRGVPAADVLAAARAAW